MSDPGDPRDPHDPELLERLSDQLQPNELTHAVIGAAIEVHRHLGPAYVESVYELALCHELELRGIRFERQVPLTIEYKGRVIGEARLDLMVEDELVVELKAIERLQEVHRAQVLSYLRTTGRRLGLLINFNVALLRDGVKRIVWDWD